MNKSTISQYFYLEREAELADELLEELRQKRRDAEGEELEFLNIWEQKLCSKKERSLKLHKDIYDYIENVDDCLVRIILFERYIKCRTWTAVANAVGGGNSPDGVRKIAERFLAREESVR